MNKISVLLALYVGLCAIANAEPLLDSALPPAIPFGEQPAVAVGAPLSTGAPVSSQFPQDFAAQNGGQGATPTGPEFRLVLAMGDIAVVKETDQSGKVLRTTTLHNGERFYYKGRDVTVSIKEGSLRLLDGRRTVATARVNSVAEAQDGPNSSVRSSGEVALSAGNGVKELKSNQFNFSSLQNSTGTNQQQSGVTAVR